MPGCGGVPARNVLSCRSHPQMHPAASPRCAALRCAGFVYDPTGSFDFFNSTGGGKFGSRTNVTLVEVGWACGWACTACGRVVGHVEHVGPVLACGSLAPLISCSPCAAMHAVHSDAACCCFAPPAACLAKPLSLRGGWHPGSPGPAPFLSCPASPPLLPFYPQCMEACQMQEECESFVYNDVLAQCFLKVGPCMHLLGRLVCGRLGRVWGGLLG